MRQSYVPSDAEVIAAAHARPQEFTELYRRHARAVFRYAVSRLGREHADDLTSETFLGAFERRARFDPEVGSALPWLLGITTRLIRRHQRTEIASWRLLERARGVGGEGTERDRLDPVVDADARIDARASATVLASAVAGLRKRDREVLALTAWSELDTPGIAAALGIPQGTVRSRLHRVRRILRSHLDAGGARETESNHERQADRCAATPAPNA